MENGRGMYKLGVAVGEAVRSGMLRRPRVNEEDPEMISGDIYQPLVPVKEYRKDHADELCLSDC